MSWVWLVAGMFALTVIVGPARRLVVSAAWVYGATNIIVVGIVFGLLFAAAVQIFVYLLISSWPAAAVLIVWGFIGCGYLAYRPDPLDEYHKAQQVATVATGVYLLVTIIVVALRTFIP